MINNIEGGNENVCECHYTLSTFHFNQFFSLSTIGIEEWRMHSLLWEFSCALQGIQQHFWPLSTRWQKHPTTPQPSQIFSRLCQSSPRGMITQLRTTNKVYSVCARAHTYTQKPIVVQKAKENIIFLFF